MRSASDNQGQVFRSATGSPARIDLGVADTAFTHNVPGQMLQREGTGAVTLANRGIRDEYRLQLTGASGADVAVLV